MTRLPSLGSLAHLTAALGLAALTLAACGGTRSQLPAIGAQDADKFLFDRGTEALKARRWLVAREYFQRLFDTYPQSPYRRDAKLGIGDAYLGEDRSDAYVLAANEFREFLNFYPLSDRADYAQFRLGDAQVRQMLGPERDQTATLDAIRELDTFVRNYANSPLMPEALALRRQARDRLSDHEFRVGRHYFRSRWYPGAQSRLQALLTTDPGFSKKDEVYYYLAETLYRIDKKSDALGYFEKLVEEYAVSEHLKAALARVSELKPVVDSQPAQASPEPPSLPGSSADGLTMAPTPSPAGR